MYRFITTLLVFCTLYPQLLSAAEISIPLRLGTGYFQHLAVKTIFTDPDQTFVAWNDDTGCNHLVLSEPVVSSDPAGILIHMTGEGRAGTPVGNLCIPLVPWQGEIDVRMKPLVGAGGRSIELSIADSSVRNSRGETALGGAIWNWTKDYVHPRLATMQVDLSRSLGNVHSAARMLFPGGDTGPVDGILDSLSIKEVSADKEGLSLRLSMKNDTQVDARHAEPALTSAEIARVGEVLAGWDVFVTLAAKQAAMQTSDPVLRDALLAVLLNTRHEILWILGTVSPGSQDPVRGLFLDTWSRLAPLLRKISIGIPDDSALDFFAFVGALDALQAIDAAGPGLNVDISVDGLRRLARLIAPPGTADPLRYSEGVDPVLRELFDFGQPVSLPSPGPSSVIDWLINSARAQSAWDDSEYSNIYRWLPTRNNINEYLARVQRLLEEVGNNVVHDKELEEPYRDIFHPLLLASAWQETCWRQFVVRDGMQKPITSSVGAVGIMQVSPRVWRGFYHPDPLTWNIAYNATAGAEILHHYLVHYAIRKEEHKKSNGVQSLARATYSAYNGGPRHLTRYRKKTTSPKLQRIDEAFWRKYEAVRAGNPLAVRQCYQ